eukprot:TRINITY_DN1254_c0_g1_i1.p1 TRINITY_DN1254_c0_g1~~TRINITY_DN1254_c0_g1_i1.p1  ORF type:complete len:1428 (+),score=191.90 TRINITY_DN1254_c0_g1_i1:258-4286(+)
MTIAAETGNVVLDCKFRERGLTLRGSTSGVDVTLYGIEIRNGMADFGGAVAAESIASLNVSHCKFTANYANGTSFPNYPAAGGAGGAVFIVVPANTNTSYSFKSVEFRDNFAVKAGGSVMINSVEGRWDFGTASFVGCSFINSTSICPEGEEIRGEPCNYGGGSISISARDSSGMLFDFQNSTFDGSVTQNGGGAVLFWYDNSVSNNRHVFSGARFNNCSAGSAGGAISIQSNPYLIQRNSRNNLVDVSFASFNVITFPGNDMAAVVTVTSLMQNTRFIADHVVSVTTPFAILQLSTSALATTSFVSFRGALIQSPIAPQRRAIVIKFASNTQSNILDFTGALFRNVFGAVLIEYSGAVANDTIDFSQCRISDTIDSGIQINVLASAQAMKYRFRNITVERSHAAVRIVEHLPSLNDPAFSSASMCDFTGATVRDSSCVNQGCGVSILQTRDANSDAIQEYSLYFDGAQFISNGPAKGQLPVAAGALLLDLNSAAAYVSIGNANFTANSADSGGAVFINYAAGGNLSLNVHDTTFHNNSATYYAGAMQVYFPAPSTNNSLNFERVAFSQNTCSEVRGGALVLLQPGDKQDPCPQNRDFARFEYANHVSLTDVIFEGNSAPCHTCSGGAMWIANGSISLRNCHFRDNAAGQYGRDIFVTGTANLTIASSSFEVSSAATGAIFSRSLGGLAITENSSIGVSEFLTGETLLTIEGGGPFTVDSTSFIGCPSGFEIYNNTFVEFITTDFLSGGCWKMVMDVDLICFPCPAGSYSLSAGKIDNTGVHPITCYNCSYGAGCSGGANVSALTSHWGFKTDGGQLAAAFLACPAGYCCHDSTCTPYNYCAGNRAGFLCGSCQEGFTHTIGSAVCRHEPECGELWYDSLYFPGVAVVAMFFVFWITFRFPVIAFFLKLLFPRSEISTSRQAGGYVKIIFYFYQVVGLLFMYDSPIGSVHRTVVSLFTFQAYVPSSTGGFCPFKGLSVVTEQMFAAVTPVFVFLYLGLQYVVHRAIIRWRHGRMFRGPPLTGRLPMEELRKKIDRLNAQYGSATMQCILLTFASFVRPTLHLLQCVPVEGKWVLFASGDVQCMQWWQVLFAVYGVCCLAPLWLVIVTGTPMLRNGSIGPLHFFAACALPLPFLFLWLLWYRNQAPAVPKPRRTLVVNSILQVLTDPFDAPSVDAVHWEAVLLLRRLLLIGCYSFISDPFWRLLCLTIGCVLALFHHSWFQPFRQALANRVESCSLLTLVVISLINLRAAAYASAGYTPTGPTKSTSDVLDAVQVIFVLALPFLLALMCIGSGVLWLVQRIGLCFGLVFFQPANLQQVPLACPSDVADFETFCEEFDESSRIQ